MTNPIKIDWDNLVNYLNERDGKKNIFQIKLVRTLKKIHVSKCVKCQNKCLVIWSPIVKEDFEK